MAGTIKRRGKTWWQGILLLLIIGFAAWRVGRVIGNPSHSCEFTGRDQVNALVYVAHARCRMGCRDIDEELVEQVYLKGELNCKKSSQSNGNARYALEMRDERGDMIRIIVEDDDGKHVIVTAIRLDKPDKCTCS
ncbi:MAG TPA: DUF4258 domain-containing protein [Bacteroidia bacterium]|nr:DUF4258 domain-containing protein [Bacteroidia bacterium]